MSNEERFSSVWDAIEDTVTAAASMRARSRLMMALQSWAKARKSTQADAALLLGITQPRMSDLMRGKINLFSLDSLLDMAALAGLQPEVSVKATNADAGWIGLESHFAGETNASACAGVVLEVRSSEEDASKFVVGTETSSGPVTANQSHLTVVKLKRAA